jgi:cysteinyl-tRNA synthetase
VSEASMSDVEVEAQIAERMQAKKARNFTRADEIRAHLLERGVILEDTKEGSRWKRR